MSGELGTRPEGWYQEEGQRCSRLGKYVSFCVNNCVPHWVKEQQIQPSVENSQPRHVELGWKQKLVKLARKNIRISDLT